MIDALDFLDRRTLDYLDHAQNTATAIQLGSLCAFVGDQEIVVYLYASTGRKNGQRVGELGPEDFLALRSGPTLADASNAFRQKLSARGLD